MEYTVEQLQADIRFLVHRANGANALSCGARFTGMSSNALVRFAYGGKHDQMPSDRSDYAACVRTVRMLPPHRRTPEVYAALMVAKEAYLERQPSDRNAAERRRRLKAVIGRASAREP